MSMTAHLVAAEGMVLKAEPIFEAVESIWPERPPDSRIILLSAQGRNSTSDGPGVLALRVAFAVVRTL